MIHLSSTLASSLLVGFESVSNADAVRIWSKWPSVSYSPLDFHVDVGSHGHNRSPFHVTGFVVHEISGHCR